jgi:uncharacterized protein YuzE
MKITYHEGSDLLYIRLDERRQQVLCTEPSDGVVLELGEEDRIVGIEILDASKRVDLDQFLTVDYRKTV